MWGIIKKDFYDTFCLPKNLLGNTFGYLFMVGMTIFASLDKPMLSLFKMPMMILLVGFAVPVTSVAVLQAAMEQDEMTRYDDIMLTYPLTKKEIVLARFIDNLLYIGFNSMISMFMMLWFVYVGGAADIQTGLLFWTVGIVFSIFVIAVFSVGFYALGNKKGTFLYIILIFAGGIFYWFIRFTIPFTNIMKLGPWGLTGIGFVISLGLLFISYWVCLKIYTRRHS